MVDRCRTRFRTVACVWPVGALVFLRRGLLDYLSLALSVVRRVCVSRHEPDFGRSFDGFGNRSVFQPVCRAWRRVRDYGLRPNDEPAVVVQD